MKTYSANKYYFNEERKCTSSIVYPIGTIVVDVYEKNTDFYRATIPKQRFIET